MHIRLGYDANNIAVSGTGQMYRNGAHSFQQYVTQNQRKIPSYSKVIKVIGNNIRIL